jgi:hypothetical protein
MNESLKKMLLIPYLKTIHSTGKTGCAIVRTGDCLKPGEQSYCTVHQEKESFKYCYRQRLSRQKEKISAGGFPEYQ